MPFAVILSGPSIFVLLQFGIACKIQNVENNKMKTFEFVSLLVLQSCAECWGYSSLQLLRCPDGSLPDPDQDGHHTCWSCRYISSCCSVLPGFGVCCGLYDGGSGLPQPLGYGPGLKANVTLEKQNHNP